MLLFLYGGCTSDKAADNVVARIGDFEITDEHFRNSLIRFYQRTGQAVNLNPEVFKAVIDSRIDRYAVVEFARERNWHATPEALHQKAMIERKVYMEEYERYFIHENAIVTEADLRELFRRLNTRLRVSHLYAANRETADSLYNRLQNGETFESLAAEIFQNQQLARSGGDLGYITVDEMDIAFEDIAYRMRSGEVSRPVKTSTGYSIIRVTDIVQNPVITETEFARNLQQIRPLAYDQKRELALRQDMQAAVQRFNISEELVRDLWNHVRRQPGLYYGDHYEAGYIPLELPRRLNEINLVETADFNFSVQDFLVEAYYTPAPRRQAATDFYGFREQVNGMAYRAYALSRIRDFDALDAEYVKGSVDETFYSYLFGLFEEYLDGEIVISDQEIAEEYEKNGEYYMKPLELNMAEIITGSEMDANRALQRLQEGVPFERVLEEYGIDKMAGQTGGMLGFVPVNEFGVLAPSLAGINAGDIAGPFQVMNNRYVIFKCLGRREAETLPLELAESRIREYLHNARKSDLRDQKISETRRSYNATIYTDKLNSVPIEL
ncbi:MAG: peptidylprolyl isomerase [Cyclonatronaceae bacterium]